MATYALGGIEDYDDDDQNSNAEGLFSNATIAARAARTREPHPRGASSNSRREHRTEDDEEETRKSEDENASGDEHPSGVVAGPDTTFTDYDPALKNPTCILMALTDTKSGPGKKKKETTSKRYFCLHIVIVILKY
jgi:hypothetical protein